MRSRRGALILLTLCARAVASAGEAAAAKKGPKFGSRVLKVGSRGKDVRVLQRSMSVLGVATPVNGVFTRPMRKRVKRIEAQLKLRVDGIVVRKEAKRILRAVAKRRKPQSVYYLYGLNNATVTLSAQRAGDARVDVVDLNTGLVAATVPLRLTGAGQLAVGWNGIGSAGAYMPDSVYQLQLADPGTAGASIASGQTQPFLLRAYAFPAPGTHSFGGAGARFGAPRSGHIHQGQDVLAGCGERLLAAQGGTVSVKAYQSGGAGYDLVIHGISGTDTVYMHMQKPSWTVQGQAVYTGQQIGRVGATGAASGCHLHFEHWSYPGWYQGGAPYDPLPELTYWDGYS